LLNKNNIVFDENTTDNYGALLLKAPYNPEDPYTLKAYYKDILVYSGEIQNRLRDITIDFNIDLFELTVEVKDILNLPPDVSLSPKLQLEESDITHQINSEEIEPGVFSFTSIPTGDYLLQITYGAFHDERSVNIPDDGDFITMDFSAAFDVVVDLVDSQGDILRYSDLYFEIERKGTVVFTSSEQSFLLPPGRYTIKVYVDGEVIGSKDIELTSDRHLKLVTNVESSLPIIVGGTGLILGGVLVVLVFLKRLDFTSFLKLIAICILLVALVQPWWGFTGSSTSPEAERNTQMFVIPQVMIESTIDQEKTTYDVAEMPEPFVQMLYNIVLMIYATCIIFGIGFLVMFFGRKSYASLFNIIGIIFLIAIISMFFIGTSKLCEVSIGNVSGEEMIDISIGQDIVSMQSRWGFSTGFFMVIISMVITILLMVIEVKKMYRSIMNKRL
jgi:hypothetical protein